MFFILLSSFFLFFIKFVGDGIEISAIESIFVPSRIQPEEPSSRPLFVSSTKGSTGHLLGAAGALESAFTVMAIHSNLLPPTLNLDNPQPPLSQPQIVRHVAKQAVEYPGQLDVAINNSFGFGGANASIVFKRF